MSSYAQIVRDLTPPVVWKFGKRKLPALVRAMGGHYTHIRFEGDYATFEAARQASEGYDAPSILQRTRESVLKVKNGQNRWERDAMVSDSLEMHWPLLACLTRIAAVKGNQAIRVIDFGGSLGSTFYWCRPFLAPELSVRWHVVEQPGHVDVGRSDFQDDELRFSLSVEEVLREVAPDVLLLSGVLHFLEKPEEFLSNFSVWKIPHLILDRTPLWNHARHRLTVQHVPEEIYCASYPAWFLSKERIFSAVEREYRLRWTVPDTEVWEIDGEPVQNHLYFFDRRTVASSAVNDAVSPNLARAGNH